MEILSSFTQPFWRSKPLLAIATNIDQQFCVSRKHNSNEHSQYMEETPTLNLWLEA